MQTTLLGLAITVILALVTALVAPLFIDWTRYRTELEVYASQLSGLEIHITGPIEARLLPTPTLVMQGIEIARADDTGSVRARALRVEFELGALVRGQWRLSEARLQGPEITAGLDADGRVMASLPKLGFGPKAIAIEHLKVEGGRAILTHAESGSRLVLENIEFRGELRSLSGRFKGEGSFVAAGQHFPYRISAIRAAENNAAKVRLTLDPIDRPVAAELEFIVSLDRGMPHFDGQLLLYRSVGRAPTDSASPIVEPWRLTTRIVGDSAAAELDQIEFQYGPDERSAKLRGSAHMELGINPHISAQLSSPQVDLDALSGSAGDSRRQPLGAMKLLGMGVVGSAHLPIPTVLNIGIEAVGLAGATLQRVNAELESKDESWSIRKLEFRAPGASQIRLSGRLPLISSSPQFAGSVHLQTNDPRALAAWLGAADVERVSPSGPLQLDADVTASNDAIDIERLRLGLDRTSLTGHFRYAWGGERGARLDTALATSEIDLDQIYALASPLIAKRELAWPREGSLSLKAERALVLGVQARQVDVNVRIDAAGLQIDPLMIADFGGAALAARGRIDTGAKSTGGAVTLDLDAHNLDGVVAVLDRFAPETADQVRHYSSVLTPVALRASLNVNPGSAGIRAADSKFKADGRAGAFRLTLLGDIAGARGALNEGGPLDVSAADMNLIGRVETDDGAILANLLRLDRVIAVDKQPGRLAVTAKGPLEGQIEFASQLSVGALDATAKGRVQVWPQASPRAELGLVVRNAKFRSPRRATDEGAPDLIPASFKMRVGVADGKIDLTDVQGTFAGQSLNGRLAIAMQQPLDVHGELDLGALNLPAAIATVLGLPMQLPSLSSSGPMPWPSEPFTQSMGQPSGQILLKVAHVDVLPNVDVQHFKGVLRFGEGRIALQVIEGVVAGGGLTGELVLLRDGEGLIARTRVRIEDASAADLLPGNGVVSGRLKLDLSAEGAGMTARALIGSLQGSGTFSIDNARVARLDPKAFEMVTRAVDQGLPIDPDRLRDRVDVALAGGRLLIPRAEGAIAISGGQARVTNLMPGERNTELALSGAMSFVDLSIDAHLVLSHAEGADANTKGPAQIELGLKGPFAAPKRSISVGSFANWLALRAVDQATKKLDLLEYPQQASTPPDHAEQPLADKKQRPPEAAGSSAAPTTARHRAAVRARPKTSTGEPTQPAPSVVWPPQWFFGAQ